MRDPTSRDDDHAGSPAHLLAIVISHADAPISEWGSLLLDAEAVRRALTRAREIPGVQGLAILATCSRTDVYADVQDPAREEVALRSWLQECTQAPPAVVGRMRTLRPSQAVRHLFRVTAGLESIALGEHEIIGQVRQALRLAEEQGVDGPLVHRLLERALATGARARHETSIGRGATTLGFAAAAAATTAGPPAPDALAVVVGAGHMARQAARHLRGRGFSRLAIVNRSPERAQELADELQATAHSLPALPSLLATARVVVSAVRVSSPVIDETMLAAARSSNEAPLALVDLGSPPNIHPSCATLTGVSRLDLDGLQERLAHTRSARAGHIAEAERIVEEELRHFEGWLNYRQLVPAARRMREIYLAEARLAVEREVRRGAVDDPQQLQRFAESLVRRLLHRPLAHLHAMARTPAPDDGDFVLEVPELERCVLESYHADSLVSDHT